MTGVRAATALARREVMLFARQPARIAAAIGTPLLIWLFLASGFASSFAGQGAYGGYLLPGMMTLVALFTAIFSCISVIEDRQQGWLQAVLVSPAPRWSIAAGKIAGGGVVAWAQATILIGLAWVPSLGEPTTFGGAALAIVVLAVTCIGLTGLGLVFAWHSETSAAFHGIMNLLLMPMWLLSGAFFPPDGATTWLRWLMWLNPMTWCSEALRAALAGQVAWPALAGTAVFAVAAVTVATIAVGRQSSRH